MKTKLPIIGETDVCVDDSCDGGHCIVCGTHFIEWYTHKAICERCQDLSIEEQQLISSAMKSLFEDLWI